jgi:predicted DCC family thiol-disulfide oxidoreductase YuxK
LFNSQLMLPPEKILFYDSDCLFCSSWVQRIHKSSKFSNLFFSGLKGEKAKNRLSSSERESMSGIIFIVNGKKYHKGLALRRLFYEVKAPLSLLLLLTFLCPLFLLNKIYDFIAKNRHRLNGKTACEFEPTLQKKILS